MLFKKEAKTKQPTLLAYNLGNFMRTLALPKEVGLRDVRAVAEKLHRENPQGAVVIQADRDSQVGVVVDIMDTLNQMGVPNVSLAALERN